MGTIVADPTNMAEHDPRFMDETIQYRIKGNDRIPTQDVSMEVTQFVMSHPLYRMKEESNTRLNNVVMGLIIALIVMGIVAWSYRVGEARATNTLIEYMQIDNDNLRDASGI